MNALDKLAACGLYRPEFEHDNCGFGLIAQIDGRASHRLVKTAIEALGRMTHRGAIAADGKSGDGCGLLLRKPVNFLRAVATDENIELGRNFATGMIFLSRDDSLASRARDLLAQEVEARNLTVNGWRVVPTDESACGLEALRSRPQIEQLFVTAPSYMDPQEFNRNLFVARRRTEIALREQDPNFYVCSLSADVILYKGLMMPDRLPAFYEDLNDERLESRLAVFHQRFSTNTLPQWRLRLIPFAAIETGLTHALQNFIASYCLNCASFYHWYRKPAPTPCRWTTCWKYYLPAVWIYFVLCACCYHRHGTT